MESDWDLVRRAQGADQEAFRLILSRYPGSPEAETAREFLRSR